MVNNLLKYFPHHHTYVELFGGGASILLNKKPSKVEIYNDINGNLVNFFRVIRDKSQFKKFYQIVSLIPYSRKEFFDAKRTLNEGDDVERAVKFFIIGRMSFSAKFGSSWGYARFLSRNNKASVVNSYLTSIEALPHVSQRLKNVQIDARSYEQVMKYFSDSRIFIYADPPYLNTLSTSWETVYPVWSEDEHKKFLSLCLRSKSKIMISGRPSELYDNMLNSWEQKTFKSVLISAKADKEDESNNRRKQAVEKIWMNYQLNKHIDDFL
jgi:DNA adenine methylase